MSITSINQNTTTTSIENPQSTDSSKKNNKFTLQPLTYTGPGINFTPGITNIFYAPEAIYKSIKGSIRAIQIGDKEGILENFLRTGVSSTSILHAISQCAWYILTGGQILKIIPTTVDKVVKTLNQTLCIVGFVMCGIEAIIEGFGLWSQFKFYHSIRGELEAGALTARLNEFQQSHFEISSRRNRAIDSYIRKNLSHLKPEERQARKEKLESVNLQRKKDHLARRIQPWMAKEIEEKIGPLLENSRSSDPTLRAQAHEEANKLFSEMKIQSRKKLIIHVVALVAIAITTAGLVTSFLACPLVIPFALIGLSTLFSCARYYLHQGWSQTRGWDFSIKDCIPVCIQRAWKKAFAPIQEVPYFPHGTYTFKLPPPVRFPIAQKYPPLSSFILRSSSVS